MEARRESCAIRWLAVVDFGGVEYAIDVENREFRELLARERGIAFDSEQGRQMAKMTIGDGQTLVLLNRDNWQVCEETGDGTEELEVTVCQDDGPEERRRARENARLAEKLIAFCIDHWDNEFVLELLDELQVQRMVLEGC